MEGQHLGVKGGSELLLKGDMKRMIRIDGHLRLEGDESVVDLRIAILNLHQHSRKCMDPPTDDPIHLLLPDVSAVVDKPGKYGNAAARSRGMPRRAIPA